MKKQYLRIILIAIVSFLALYFFSQKLDRPQKIIDDQYVENNDLNPQEIHTEFVDKNKQKVYLKEGNEKFGLAHILMRHSADYYKDYNNKGSLFPEGATSAEIIKAIGEVVKKGETDPKGKGNVRALKKVVYLHKEKAEYRLIIDQNNDIITFFKID